MLVFRTWSLADWRTSWRFLHGASSGEGVGSSSVERAAWDLPVSLVQQLRYYPRRLTGYQQASGATGERKKIKRDFKRK
jgi:hypothetical protein